MENNNLTFHDLSEGYEKLHKEKCLFLTNNFSNLIKKKSVVSRKISEYFNILDDKNKYIGRYFKTQFQSMPKEI